LREAVRKGPVLAIVKLGLMATGDNHAVVVTGISDDGQQVRINDPWDGQSHTYPWDQFSTSWGANFGKDAPKNSFVVIRPS
jgi:ABC-type bacteriocin/lantibiotic exporter with double-glycine peptidase domain